MKSTIKLILCLILIQMATGCNVAYRVLLGIDTNVKWENKNTLNKRAKQYRIPRESIFIMDTVLYDNGLAEIYSTLAKEIRITEQDSSEYHDLLNVYKDDAQPTQFRLFNQDGEELFKLVNCYIDPPIPMRWNVNGCFDEFPPKIDIESLNTHNYDLNFLLESSTTLHDEKIKLSDLPKADYYGVIFWNDVFRRPSRKLIKTVKKYVRDSEESIYLLYINNHNAYLWGAIDSDTKAKIKGTTQ